MLEPRFGRFVLRSVILRGFAGRCRRRQRRDLVDQRLAVGLLGLELDLIPPFVAFEERIAGASEARPDRLRLVPPHGTDGFPFGLQPADLAGGLFPLARDGELFGARAQRFLLREVGSPGFLALRKIGISPREELIAGIAETLPGRLACPDAGPDR